MSRKKQQRENYGEGGIVPVMIDKKNAKGIVVIDKETGKPAKVQKRDREGKQVWRIVITKGTETVVDASGRHKRQLKVQKNFHGTLTEARAFRSELIKAYENVDITSAKNTFAWACERWVGWAHDKNLASADSIKQYETRLGYVSAYIGDKRLAELTADDIDEAVAGAIQSRNLSNTTGRKVFAAVKRVLKFCVDRGWLVKNPADATIAPIAEKVDPVSRKALTREDAARLRAILDRDIEAAVTEYNAKESRQAGWGNTFGRSATRGLGEISNLVCVRLLLASGCRRGEILGLVWDAVNFTTNEITIRQTLTARQEVKVPKTESGLRTLTLDASTMSLLGWWKNQQALMLHRVMPEGVALCQTLETPVCVNDSGGWCDPNHVGRWWRSYRVSIGFDTLLLHELRHTSASLLLGSGYDLMTLANRLGHKKATLTLSEYGHMMKVNDQMAASLMGDILDTPTQVTATVVEMKRRTA